MKLFDEEVRDLGRESKAGGGETTTKQSNGWRSMPRLGKSRIGEATFYSGFKEPKGNRKPDEASVNRKRKAKESSSSPYLLVDDDDDDDDDVVGYDAPRSISFLYSTAF